MSDQDIRETKITASPGEEASPVRWPFRLWAMTTLGFLVYLAAGSVEIRLWRFGRLRFEDRRITHVWAHFCDRLPDLSGGGMIHVLYWFSLLVIIAGIVAGLWVILVDRTATARANSGPVASIPPRDA